ncbi:MAG: ATP-binding cassette domain-containing protein [Oscillospiraceae bacterium]|jgi:ABC-2 type transport system ATP-binding protein|nr:ATP-binding cassette domain-containing protein [Oscillospiraceae bacterium]
MSEIIFSARSLTKRYRRLHALDSVNMEVRRGDIYGFVGENGAGKTTLIRVLAGLAAPDGGEIALFGETGGLAKGRRRIGGMVETPAVYPNFTARENLEVCRMQRGIADRRSIDRALETVGLTDTGKKKAKNFSLGMKQRLGLAMALLGDPEFLILDEPVNGLDPAGIMEFRELLRKLNAERGITILISSHLLAELFQLATCYGFIHKGRMLEQVTIADLTEKFHKQLHLRVDDPDRAIAVLEAHSFGGRKLMAERTGGNALRISDMPKSNADIVRALVAGGVGVEEVAVRGDALEDYYMSLIGGRR